MVLYRTHDANRSDDWQFAAEGRMRLAAKHFMPLGEESDTYRRFVAHSQVATGLVRVRAGNREAGTASIREGIDRCPELLESDDVLYELAAAFEPRGLQGTASGTGGAELVLSLIDGPGRQRFRGRARLVLARLALSAGDRVSARRHAVAALGSGTLHEKTVGAALLAAASIPSQLRATPR